MKKAFCVLAAAMLMLTACGAPEEDAAPTAAATATPAASGTASPSQAPVEVATRSYTSGRPVTERAVYKPVGVVIENNDAARPQYGLQEADIVYEAPVEGCTRFFCIYGDTLPEVAGPVRSARVYFIRIQQEWDCAFVHFGGPESGKANVYGDVAEHIDTRVNFIKGGLSDYYWRDSKRAAPHNAFTNVSKLPELMEQEATPRSFAYSETADYSGNAVSEITLPFFGDPVSYRFDAASGLLTRYMDGNPFMDAGTEAAVTVQNLIVQYANFYHGEEIKGRWLCDLTGSGKAEFVIAGKHVTGTWERADYDSPTVFKDDAGSEIVLRPGNTWVALHPDSEAVTVAY